MRDPREQEREASDYRFKTQFQQDYYETVIIIKNRIVSEAVWVDWYHLESMNNPTYDQMIAACERANIKKLMAFKFDWNIEVVAQFIPLYTLRRLVMSGRCTG